MERSAFLDRVRGALAGSDRPLLPPTLPATFATGDGRAFERFADELAATGGTAERVAAQELVDAVVSFARGSQVAVVAGDLDGHREVVLEGLQRAGCEVLGDARADAARADLGVTGALLGVASTGSVLLASGPGAPRMTGLLPPVHLVVLREDSLVGGLEDLFDRLPSLAVTSSELVLVTGPSRTSDIEMTLVRGVHGPERVTVLVVSA